MTWARSARRVSIVAATLWVGVMNVPNAQANLVLTASVGAGLIFIDGGGAPAGAVIKFSSADLIGKLTADAMGNFHGSFFNKKDMNDPTHMRDNVEIGSEVDAFIVAGGIGEVEVTAKEDLVASLPGPLDASGIYGPLTSTFANAELALAGFIPGTVDLIGVSPNATILSQTTTYDLGTDTITTVGTYNVLNVNQGPILGTYDVTGEFTALLDENGLPLTGDQTLEFTRPIVDVVPEPSTLALAAGGVLATLCIIALRRRPARKGVRPEKGSEALLLRTSERP